MHVRNIYKHKNACFNTVIKLCETDMIWFLKSFELKYIPQSLCLQIIFFISVFDLCVLKQQDSFLCMTVALVFLKKIKKWVFCNDP